MNKNAIIAVLALAGAAVATPAAEPSRNPPVDASMIRCLPTPCLSDLAGVVRSFAVRADPETWEAIRGLLKTTGDALAPKANLVVDALADCGSMALSNEEKAKAADTLASFFAWMSSFAGSQTSSLESMKEWSASEIEGIAETSFSAQALDSLFLFACSRPAVEPSFGLFFLELQNSQRAPVLDAFVETYAAAIEKAGSRAEQESGEFNEEDRVLVEAWADFIAEVQKIVVRMDFKSPEAKRTKDRLLVLAPALDAAVQQLAGVQTSGELQTRIRTMADVFLGAKAPTMDFATIADSFFAAKIVGPDCARIASRGRNIAREVFRENLDREACSKSGILGNEDKLASRIDYNLWNCLSGPIDSTTGDVPFLFTRNLKVTDEDLRRVLRTGEPVEDESWSSKLDPNEKPFGNGLVVVVTLRGAVRPILARDLTASRFFGDAIFEHPQDIHVLPAH